MQLQGILKCSYLPKVLELQHETNRWRRHLQIERERETEERERCETISSVFDSLCLLSSLATADPSLPQSPPDQVIFY